MGMDTNRAAALAEETVEIIRRGSYTSPSGTDIDLRADIDAAVAATREHPPDEALAAPNPVTADRETTVAVTADSTLVAARRLVDAGHDVVALNFGSARHPGGGFLTGAIAQEESLCRASALYACLEQQPMYAFHRMRTDPLYSHRVIHAPRVPVFRDDDGNLLDAPWRLSFLTAPAVNARMALERDAAAASAVNRVMRERAARVLAVAAAHGHDALVLGAWGCGVFGNDPAVVADAFAEPLAGPFRGVFAAVTFAIMGAPDSPTRQAFATRFA